MTKKLIFTVSAFLFIGYTHGQSTKPMAVDASKSTSYDMSIFGDALATTLAPKVTKGKISKMQNSELKSLATSLLSGNYNTDYRVAQYEAYLSPDELGKQLQIGNGYSNYENMTGILLEAGPQTIIVSGLGEGKSLKIMVPNWDRRAPEGISPTKDPNGWGIIKDDYMIKDGVNVVDVKKSGLVYLDYYSAEPEKENKISVHFVGDKVNGYFDITKNDNNDWDALLKNAVYPVIDARGRHSQIAYPVEACVKYASGRGVELLSSYDSLVRRQHRFIGLEKYNRVPKNRILARVNYNYYMFRDGDGVAYMGTQPGYAMGMVADPDKVIAGDPCWGFSHEVGHVHQLRPYLNWGGLGEVSNNIITMYVIRSFGVESRLAKQDNYNKARKEIIEGGISFLESKDFFNRLIPFWQLHLYFGANGYSDFYADLHEQLRNLKNMGGDDWGSSRGKEAVAYHQLNFIKNVCKIGKTDLTDFFEKWGFFKVGEFELDDYGKFKYQMTQEMVDACKTEIAAMNLPKPKCDLVALED